MRRSLTSTTNKESETLYAHFFEVALGVMPRFSNFFKTQVHVGSALHNKDSLHDGRSWRVTNKLSGISVELPWLHQRFRVSTRGFWQSLQYW
jgi:hypothetical protein